MNVRISLLQWSLVVLPFVAVAQPRQLMTSARPNAVRPVSSTATESQRPEAVTDVIPAETTGPLNTLPLFGERPKTAEQIDAEIHFLNDCDRNFASRAEASEFFAARGWDYVNDGQLDTAAYRFNMAWLLNERNVDAYWGLGVVSYQRSQLPDAIRMLKKGVAVVDTNAVLLTDLATVQIKYYQQKQHPGDLEEAEAILLKSVAINPNSAASHQKLSLVNFLRANYVKAWTYFHQARELNLSELDLSYLNDLLSKQPDPKGIFR